MTKTLTILILVTISFNLLGQSTDSIGIGKNDFLTKDESTYLNDTFIKARGDFNFEKKKIGFFVGSGNHRLWTKQDYFTSVQESLKNNTTMQHQLLILNEDERIKSGGYYAFVIAWSKILVTDGQKTKLINKITGTQK